MVKKRNITLPSDFADIIDRLGDDVSIPQIEEIIILHAVEMFAAQWGSIKYYYGDQFVNGFTSVPPEFRLTPRKRGFMFRTVDRDKPHVMTEKLLREAHPEARPEIKSILLTPLRMNSDTFATVSLVDTRDRSLTEREVELLSDFGTVYGRVLNMAHKFAAEKRASTNREKFMSFAAHEIKNPLMALSSYIQLIQRALEKKKEVKSLWLYKMGEEVIRMKTLIDELLNVRHSQDGELIYNKETLSLKTLLTQVFDNFKVRNPQRNVKFTYDVKNTELEIIGDETKLNQVFINLLNNAHKFSELDTDIVVTVTEFENYFEVSIKDQGVGIAVEEIPFIFKEFYRGSNTENSKGIGVGLFLVKSIIQSHDGQITVKSRLGKGTTFTVQLPRHLS